ncbi:SGNH/GDSL hydrolase family protein [Granulicella sp. S156]|jgi:lysophospholipase L1-like esterase|uniref:SGNH/GDSL hydrolase family protein n=1 Tax=Granulicella sp. S156 TaxID=1747224 RepID=UPI00131D0166|nr:SGNH/GDSL hydrolase family protein [Granulicella sp. S156]
MRYLSVLAFLLVSHSLIAQEKLPALAQHSVVLFQGDSITDGGRARSGQDFNHTMGQDYAYILSARIGAEHPEWAVTFVNRGISGNRVLDLAARWQADTLDLKPTLLSILVGVNDALATGERAESVEQFTDTYDQLLADTIKELPGVQIVLGEPFLLPVGKHKEPYAVEFAELRKRQAVVAQLAEKYHLPLIHYQEIFDRACRKAPAEYWLWDGVHPSYAGHALMAEEWARIVRKSLPKP